MKCIKVGIVGSGAVTQKGYLPAIRAISDLQVTWIVDPNIDRARDVARQFNVANYTGNYKKVLDKVHAVVIATPPALHASISKDCLMNAIHVLCEKPLAKSTKDARELVEIADYHDVHFAVSSNRRFCASSQLIKSMIGCGLVGRLSRFEVEIGTELSWPMRSGYRFKEDLTGGGILAELGPHVLDLLFWWLEDHINLIKCKYKDDNFGGVEANSWIELMLQSNSNEILGSIALSNTRVLSNMIRLFGERGIFEIPALGGQSILFYPNSDLSAGVQIEPANLGDYPRSWTEQIGVQLSLFVKSIIENDVKYVPAEDAVKVTEIIEFCYAAREIIFQSWEAKWVKQ